jgi:hypothetical protein
VIKASDFTGNAVGLIHTTGPMLPRLADEYGPLVPELRELILRPDTPGCRRQGSHRQAASQRRGAVRGDLARPRSRRGPDALMAVYGIGIQTVTREPELRCP